MIASKHHVPITKHKNQHLPPTHPTLPGIETLQGQSENGKAPWEGVRERCRKEWGMFQTRIAEADKAYYEMMGVTPPNVTFVH
jgi:hypothetical protein